MCNVCVYMYVSDYFCYIVCGDYYLLTILYVVLNELFLY